MTSEQFHRYRDLVVRAREAAGPFDLDAMRERLDQIGGELPDGAALAWRHLGGVRVGVVTPDAAPDDAVVLYLHGGGYVAGSVRSHLALVGALAVAIGCRVVVPEYRLAPEHPHPAALDDALAVYRALEVERSNARIGVMGDSAGGGLAAALLVRLREAGSAQPEIGVLLSPWLDLTNDSPSRRSRADVDPAVTVAETEVMSAAYLAGADPRVPLVSPVGADLAGLAPMLVQVGDAEVLLDDSVRFADGVATAKGEVELEVWPEMIHVWHAAVGHVPEADRAIERIAAFARPRLGLNASPS